MIDAPGIYDITESEYHADPCIVPSLSRGIAHLLVTRSPMHAYHSHPRFTPSSGDDKTSRMMDDGAAVHSMLLGKGARVVPVRATYDAKHKLAGHPVRDYATNAAKEDRDAIREEGCIPVLAHEMPELARACTAVTRHMRWHQDGADFFAPGKSEAVVVWREGDLWLRCMVDRLPDDPHAPLYDLKVTKLSAAPGGWERKLRDQYAFQDAFYRRGIAAVRGIMPPPMRFVVVERDAPHGVSVMAAAPSLAALAETQVARAIDLWARCLLEDRWPGYPTVTAHVEAPTWMVMQDEERAMRDEQIEEMMA